MDKKTMKFIFVLIAVALISGCFREEKDNNYVTSSLSIGPTFLGYIDELHDYLLSAREYASGAVSTMYIDTEEEAKMKVAVNNWGLGDIQHYYIPSWLPEGFMQSGIAVTNRYVVIQYPIEEYDYGRDLDREYVLNNLITFEWTRGVKYTTDEFVTYIVNRENLWPLDGIEGMYYKDYGTTDNPSVYLKRSYYWLQEGNSFRLDVPLRTISGVDGGISKYAANVLVLNSAIKVELEDGVYYEPPTIIALDQTAVADIPVGDTITLTADVLPVNTTIKHVMWYSSDNRVVTVSQSGVITRVGPGYATITVKTLANGLTATFDLTEFSADDDL